METRKLTPTSLPCAPASLPMATGRDRGCFRKKMTKESLDSSLSHHGSSFSQPGNLELHSACHSCGRHSCRSEPERAFLGSCVRAECSGVGMDHVSAQFMESIGAVASPPGGAGAGSRLWLSPSRESSGLPVETKGQVRPQLTVVVRAPGQGGWALSWETFPFPGVFTTF